MGPLIIKYVALFPLFLSSFQEGPLTHEVLWPGPYPVIYSAERIALQRDALELGDRDARLVALRQLRAATDETAFEIILGRLGQETDPKMVAAVLAELSRSPFQKSGMLTDIVPFITHRSEDVRVWAVSLYGRLDGMDPNVLLKCLGEDASQVVREVAAERLCTRFADVPLPGFKHFWGDVNARVQASMVDGAVRRPNCAGEMTALVDLARSAAIPVRLVLAADIPLQPQGVSSALVPVLVTFRSRSVPSKSMSSMSLPSATSFFCTSGGSTPPLMPSSWNLDRTFSTWKSQR